MKQTNIELTKVISHGGVKTSVLDGVLHIETQIQNCRFDHIDMPLNSYIKIPQKFKLPLRIDISVKMDSPSLFVALGEGHVTFGTSFLDNRRIGDIVSPNPKKTGYYDNRLEMDRVHEVSVIYGLKCMQILIDAEERYLSKKERYIKSALLEELNREGFELKLAGTKQNTLQISSLVVTEFLDEELSHLTARQETDNKSGVYLSVDRGVKGDFDECISKLSPTLQEQIRGINDYLLGCKALKVKRKIEGNSFASKLSYVSTHGFSYSVQISEDTVSHFFWWYMVSNYSYQDRYMGRKNDLTLETFREVEKTSKEVADRLFSYYDECQGCRTSCLVKTFYEHGGKRRAVCHGKMIMNMKVETFKDILVMFKVLAEIVL